MEKISKSLVFLSLILVFLFILSGTASAIEVSVANSKDWKDVYSVMLSSALEDERSVFINSEVITTLTRLVSKDNELNVYESSKTPYINNLANQLSSTGYKIEDSEKSDDFNLDLDPQTGKYIVIPEDNYRLSVAVASLAVKDKYWVLFVNEDNLKSVSRKIRNADEVLAIGSFRRDFLDELEDSFTKVIDNNDIFTDSQEVATLYGIDKNIVLADGFYLESEFFTSKNPVILSGHNKILDDTFEFITEKNVDSVVIVGNELAVVGEQIRSRSNKKISVFIKFGQSNSESDVGRVYALTMFEMPQQNVELTVDKVIYNPESKELIAYFHNLGNTGIYELTTISVKENGLELGSASDDEVLFLGAGEILPVKYDVSIPMDEITEETMVEFYTSYGVYPSQLDSFLTMENKYGPPFALTLGIEEIGDDSSKITIDDAVYFSDLKRVGITITNTGETDVFCSIKLRDLIVNGLKEDLFKESEILAGETSVVYLPVELDKVDREENKKFKLSVTYGKTQDLLLNSLKLDLPFQVKTSNLITGLVAGIGEGSPIGIIIIVLILAAIAGGIIYFKRKK